MSEPTTPPDIAAMIAQARQHLADGRIPAARAEFEAVLAIRPANRPAMLGLGQCSHLAGDHADALTWFERAREAQPDDPPAMARVGQQLRLLGRVDEAIALLTEAVTRFPERSGPWIELARAQAAAGNVGAALAAWQRAALCDPPSAVAVREAARGMMLGGDTAGALSLIDAQLPRLGDDGDITLAMRARVLMNSGDFDESLATAGRLRTDSPEARADALSLRAEIEHAQWRLREAEATMAEACALAPTPERWDALAQIRLTAADPDGAAAARQEWARSVRARRAQRSTDFGDVGVRETQGLIGDIINEWRLDRTATMAARDALGRRDVVAAGRAVRQHPRSIAAATALLVTMRCAGELALQPTGSPDSGIPTRVVRAWFGTPAPREVLELGEAWAQACPGWRIDLFDEERAYAYLQKHHGERAASAFLAARLPAARADLFRLGLLAADGGVWSDADDLPLQSLQPLLAGRTLVVWQEERGNIGNNFLAAAPGHPVITTALAEVVENCLTGYTESTWLATGPGVITRAFAGWIATDPPQVPDRTSVVAAHELRRHVTWGLPLRYKETELNWQRAEQHRS